MKRALEYFGKTDVIALLLIIVACVGMLSLPYLVTQTSYLNSRNINYGTPNEIADMIGGISGPFISLISACLVYLTIREQIKANEITRNQFLTQEDARIGTEMYLMLLEKIKSWKNESETTGIHSYAEDSEVSKNVLQRLLSEINIILDKDLFLKKEQKLEEFGASVLGQAIPLNALTESFYLAISNTKERHKLELLLMELESLTRFYIKIPTTGILQIITHANYSKEVLKLNAHQIFTFTVFEIFKIQKDIREVLYGKDGVNKYGVKIELVNKEIYEIEKIYKEDAKFKHKLNTSYIKIPIDNF